MGSRVLCKRNASSQLGPHPSRPEFARPALAFPYRQPGPALGDPNWNLTTIPPKLEIGPVDDPLERAADAVADRVMGMSDSHGPTLQNGVSTIRRKCGACREADETRHRIARKETACVSPETVAAPPIVHDVLREPGQMLDADTRAFMEPRFGSSLSKVRIHNDVRSGDSARAVGASAYTVGRDIVFAPGRYAPHLSAGRWLLAHELTHVIQQDHLSANRGDTARGSNSEEVPGGLLQRDVGCDSRSWPDGCVAPGGCDAGKQCVAPGDWSVCGCWDTRAAEERVRAAVPQWIITLLGAAALLALIACFATGVCEVAAVVGGLGAAAAAVLLAILHGLGLGDKRATASTDPAASAGDESTAGVLT